MSKYIEFDLETDTLAHLRFKCIDLFSMSKLYSCSPWDLSSCIESAGAGWKRESQKLLLVKSVNMGKKLCTFEDVQS
jgi:hypothetical protein